MPPAVSASGRHRSHVEKRRTTSTLVLRFPLWMGLGLRTELRLPKLRQAPAAALRRFRHSAPGAPLDHLLHVRVAVGQRPELLPTQPEQHREPRGPAGHGRVRTGIRTTWVTWALCVTTEDGIADTMPEWPKFKSSSTLFNSAHPARARLCRLEALHPAYPA